MSTRMPASVVFMDCTEDEGDVEPHPLLEERGVSHVSWWAGRPACIFLLLQKIETARRSGWLLTDSAQRPPSGSKKRFHRDRPQLTCLLITYGFSVIDGS